MALAPVAYLLYTRVMRHSPEHPDWPARDRFVLSAGHASMLLYSILHLTGYGISLDDLKNFRQLGSPTAGHPEYGHAPGIETTTGPLGQGISTAVGMALGERMLAAGFEEEMVAHFTYVIASDGDLEEGIASEASSLAGHLGLGRLITFYDDNHISIEGDTALSFSEDVGKRYEAYGWHVQNLGEDLDLDNLERAVEEAQGVTDQPSLIIIRTHIAPGSPNKQDTHEAHGSPLGEEEIRLTKQAYDWPSEEPFFVPDEALEHFRECVDRGRELYEEWDSKFPDRDELERILARRLPDGWDADVPKKGPDAGMIATRKASNEVIQWAAAQLPELIGGSADLAPSTLTLINGGGSVEAGRYGGRNLHFGIREHGMGAIVNGLTLSGFRAFGADVPDLQRLHEGRDPARRDHAASRRSFVFTHDSIGLGEDGPTHQPIEQLATLRATPNLDVVRPGRLQRDRARLAPRAAPDRPADRARPLAPGPAGVGPVQRPGRRDRARRLRAAGLRRRAGADPDGHRLGGPPWRTRRSSCSAADGVRVRLVSMPCLDRFAEQDQEYRDRCCRRECGRAWRSRRPARSAGTAGSATTATSSPWRASAPPPRRRRCTSISGSAGRRSRIAPAPFWRGARS